MINLKKIALVSIIVVAACAAGLVLAEGLEITYPDIYLTNLPTTSRVALPEYINYILNFAMIISGLIIFGSITYAGIRYLTSMGNPAALKDSKDQILSAFLGVVILFSSYLIMRTINPRLTMITPPEIQIEKAIEIRFATGEPLIVTASVRNLAYYDSAGATVIKFIGTNSEEVDVIAYPDAEYGGVGSKIIGVADVPITLSPTAKSISINWKLPGIYLYSGTLYQGEQRLYMFSQNSMLDFNDAAQSVRVRFTDADNKYGVVLFEKENFQGQCVIITGDTEYLSTAGGSNLSGKVSSMIVFQPSSAQIGTGVTFYKNQHLVSRDGVVLGPLQNVSHPSLGEFNDNIGSFSMNGNFLVAIFKDTNFTNDCEVWVNKSDESLVDNPSGRCLTLCGISLINWNPFCFEPCASSLVVIPLKF